MGLLGGHVVIMAEDAHKSLLYANKAATAASKGSVRPWMMILPAFAAMEGRTWSDDMFEFEKQRFMSRIQSDSYSKHSASAVARYKKKDKLKEKMRRVREAKKIAASK
jgi:hypothetical protein